MNTKMTKSLVRHLLLSALLCTCFLVFPLRVQAGQDAPAECLFNWAELNYPALLAPAGSPTQFWTVYSYRHYPATNAYLGVNSVNNHVYYLGPEGVLQDVGPLADWSPKAGCPVPPPSPAECLFNWAELNYPGLFAPAGSPWAISSIDWTYRYYSLTNAYLRIQSSDNHVYYQGPNGLSQDVGSLSDWTPKASCRPPVANAGPDQTAYVSKTITLDGSASSDLDGDLITYQWTLSQKPASSQTVLSNPNALHPTLAIDKPGTYLISLVVNDGQFYSTPATITINTQNSKPVANAGNAQSGKVGDTLTLDGSASHDVDGDTLTYHWTLQAKPQNSNAQFNNPDTVSPRLTLDKPGNYTAQLTVNDGKADSASAKIVLSTVNSRPVAKAGPAQSILLNTPAPSVQLDGSASSDADSDPLSFRWALISKPAGSLSFLLDPLAPLARFTPDYVGDYVAQLIVNDGHVDSAPNTALITVLAPPPPQNHPPQISTSPVLTATVGGSYSYDVDAGDSDNDTLTYSLSVFPSGMTVNALSGLISWTPAANQTGPQGVTINVSDGKGGSDSQSYAVTVATAELITVPDLSNKSRAAAETAIQQAKLNVGTLSFEHNVEANGNVISQNPAANSSTTKGTAVNLTISLGPDQGLPPDPATVAPNLDNTVATNTYTASRFLYSGSNPVQTGVATGAIEAKRAAVLRGKVLDKQNNPLSGVTVSIKNHPELGQTQSRSDGVFDLAVNGGGLLTLNYQLNGYLKSQRQIQADWQGYANVDDVVMIQVDTKVSTINLTDTTKALQVAKGSTVNDDRGSRTAELLIPRGTQASILNPDGSTVPVEQLHLRFTEYTVGANGLKAMPGPLPPTSSYTYAVEISPDEAIAKVAGREVIFDRPVPYYVDNFLHMPIGIQVPVGYYDPDKSAWIASPDGRVIKILSIVNGEAQVDSDGDSQADDGSSIGMTQEERMQLAQLHAAGTSLWRVPMKHLSTYDHNYGSKCKAQCKPPDVPPPPPKDPKVPDPNCKSGSIIECENQVLGETLLIPGTPYTLNYRSDRVEGRKSGGNSINIPITGTTVPQNVKKVLVEVHIAGRVIYPGEFGPIANLSVPFTWDGKDARNRIVQGNQTATIRIGYQYAAVYTLPPSSNQSFGQNSGQPIEVADPAPDIVLWQEYTVDFGSWDALKQGIGAWTLSVHHTYDPVRHALYLGDGSVRFAKASQNATINTVAGNGVFDLTGDGIPATSTGLGFPAGIVLGPDDSLYISESDNGRIRRVGPDGIITTVAGNGTSGFSGDGGPAISASLSSPGGVAIGPEGSLYIADSDNHRIRRIEPNGIISTMAGNGVSGFSGDGGPAISAGLMLPTGIALGPDGSLYIADSDNHRVRQVGPDGIITTVAGNGASGFSGDGGPAISSSLNYPIGLALGPDGSLLIADTRNNRIRRVGPDGIITTVAGSGESGFSGDGGSAILAKLGHLVGVAVGSDGSVFLADQQDDLHPVLDSQHVRRIGSDGIITTVAGNGESSFSGDAGPPTSAALNYPEGVALGPDGSLYIADTYNGRVRKVSHNLPGFSDDDIYIPSGDGSELYHFNAFGRHLRTLNTLTGAAIYQFGYDVQGLLASVTDGDGNITTIERDATGKPMNIVAPFSQRTVLTLDANAYLASFANPAGETHSMVYTVDGLMTQFTQPDGRSSTMTYDSEGKLLTDTDAAGGKQTLARSGSGNSWVVSRDTSLGRTTRYSSNSRYNFSDRKLRTPDGLDHTTFETNNGMSYTDEPDGSQQFIKSGPDPRFGMQAPINAESNFNIDGDGKAFASSSNSNWFTINPPSKGYQLNHSRTATLSQADNPLSLTSLTDTRSLGDGRSYKSVFDQASKTITNTSAASRVSKSTIDSQGRVLSMQTTGLFALTNAYDAKGRLASTIQGSLAEARTVTFNYNAHGYLSNVIDPLGHAVGYEHDAAGRVTTQTLPDSRQIHYTYDKNGNLASLQPPGREAHVFKYTPVGLTDSYVPPDVGAGANQTVYEYDLDKALTKITRPDGGVLSFVYDNAGRLGKVTLPSGDITYGYGASSNRLFSITDTDGGELNFAYQGSLLNKVSWTGPVAGSVGWRFDTAELRMREIRVNGENPIILQYDKDSLLTKAGALTLSRSAQNGLLRGSTLGEVTESQNYNGFGEITGYTAKFAASALLKELYSYDKRGRIIEKKETVLDGATNTLAYSYDVAGRLVEVKKNGIVTSSYGYDDNGNRISRNGISMASYDEQDRLLEYNGKTYSYTANGELSSKTEGSAVTRYQYDALGNLKHVELPNGDNIDYLADGQNRRIGKKVNGILKQGFLWQDQLKPVAELDGSNNVVSRFVYATRVNVPDYMIKGGQNYRIVTDHLGSPRLVVKVADGSIAQRMDYDEFGNVIQNSNPGFQPFGFAGGLYDRDTGLVRFGARDYDAYTGRWMAKDPILFEGGDDNLYGYVISDPINHFDTNGLLSKATKQVIKSIAKGVVSGAVCIAIAPTAPVFIVAGLLTAAGISYVDYVSQTNMEQGIDHINSFKVERNP